ncbi:DNA replication protein DnaC [Bacillus oleivorans]|uniref:DNA replication protein DnaC n=2 Tax=Bacillus oleivorans TaxID=1448271 RepID=A0A285D7Y6_9BACI|nr:DNA replication protein DnaC [Bacillus oleivorans]
MISASDKRCPSCQRLYLLENGNEFCFYCEVVSEEDKKIGEEAFSWVEKREVIELLEKFKTKSLMNRDLEEATFETYKPVNESQKIAYQKCLRYVETFDGRKGLILQGKPGLGKSHLASSIAKKLIQSKYTCIFISLPRLLTELQGTYNKKSDTSELELLTAIQKADLLILDDLGAERTQKDDEGNTWARRKIFEVVDSRIGSATVYTTNYSGAELLKMYGERDFSRMVQNCEAIKLDGENYRISKFKEGSS